MPAKTKSPGKKRTSRHQQIVDPVVRHRVERFVELGFSHPEARLLEKCHEGSFITSGSSTSYCETRLSHHTVRKHIENGATKEQIVAIYS